MKVFLRWHGPHQVLRVEAALPLSQKSSPDFVTHHKHLREFCQGLVFIRKKGYDSTCYGEPLWLRGNNRFRPDEPDVGNANVGNVMYWGGMPAACDGELQHTIFCLRLNGMEADEMMPDEWH